MKRFALQLHSPRLRLCAIKRRAVHFPCVCAYTPCIPRFPPSLNLAEYFSTVSASFPHRGVAAGLWRQAWRGRPTAAAAAVRQPRDHQRQLHAHRRHRVAVAVELRRGAATAQGVFNGQEQHRQLVTWQQLRKRP